MADWKELQRRISSPALIAEKDPYLVKIADTPEEVLETQKLRYRVFNQEQGKGLTAAEADGIDRDEYDDTSLHLVVREKNLNMPVGTYRIILGQDRVEAMYSSREYEIKGLDAFLPMTLEVGRSCVDPEHRAGSVVALLWAGISEIMTRSGMRYLTGCVSLEDTRPEAAWAMYEYFRRQDLIMEEIHGVPRPEFVLPRPDEQAIEAVLADSASFRKLFPPLLKGYFRMGAKICGEPAFDYEFGTTDFLIILDVAHLPSRYNKHFNVTVGEKTA